MNLKYPLLLDGGLSTELEKQGHALTHNLWSAKLLESNPEAIIAAHLAYLEAGATCIITSSYQASVPGFMALGYDQAAAISFLQKSVKLAEFAVQRFIDSADGQQKPLIAASIGPYGAYMADGSEYHGNYGVTDEELKVFHHDRLFLLDRSNANLLACETIPSIQEARVLAAILEKVETPAWVSFSCKDAQHLNDGTPIGQAAALFTHHPNVFAVGVNCTAPQHISGLIKAIKQESGTKRIIVYPNSGEIYDAHSKTWQGTSDPILFAEIAKAWIALGADMVGGCCRIEAKHIEQLSKGGAR